MGQWIDLPATDSTDWSSVSFVGQFCQAIHERYLAVWGNAAGRSPLGPSLWAVDQLSTPPGSPANGAVYLVGESAAGDWAGHDESLATWAAGSPGHWTFSTVIGGKGGGETVGLFDGRIFARTEFYPDSASAWVQTGHLLRPITSSMTVQGASATPPEDEPDSGDVWAVLASATGDWAGHSKELATWDGDAWSFDMPPDGLTILCESGALLVARSDGWQRWDVQSCEEFFYCGTSWYHLQRLAEQVVFGPIAVYNGPQVPAWVDTMHYPAPTDLEGLAAVPRIETLDTIYADMGLPHADESLPLERVANTSPWYQYPVLYPVDGDRWVVWWSPTHDWAGHANTIATWRGGTTNAWTFETPAVGYRVRVSLTGETYDLANQGGSALAAARDIGPVVEMTADGWRSVVAGFTRKFPREIVALGQPGQAGHVARYIRGATDTYWAGGYIAQAVEPPRTSPPESPNDQALYLVAPHATGAWTGMDGCYAVWDDGSARWLFGGESYPPGSQNIEARGIAFGVAGTQTAYIQYSGPEGWRRKNASLWTNGSLAGWALVWSCLAESCQPKPPAGLDDPETAPPDGTVYAVSAGASGDWAGHDGDLATWQAEGQAWSFSTPAAGVVCRVHRGLHAASPSGVPKDMVRVGDPPGWSKLDGMVVEHDGNVWHLAEDQTQQPDLLTANGRARHGDYVGPWVFNELAEFLNRLRAVTRSVAYCADPSASPQSVQATYYPSGSSVSFRQT